MGKIQPRGALAQEGREGDVVALERILIVNDDLEDIRRIQAQLPERFVVEMASQAEARMLRGIDHDLAIVDNDMNDRQEPKGPITLAHLKAQQPDMPILYTSFQPGMVPAAVHQSRGVRVVKSDEVVEVMGQAFGFQRRGLPAEVSREPLVSLVISYNPVDGHSPGVHEAGDRRVIVLAFDKHAYDEAPRVIREQMDAIYGSFDFRRDRDIVRSIFVYDGIAGGERPGQMAGILGHDARMKVNLMACHCDWERKQRLGDSYYVDLFQVECGGERSMGMVADLLLGVRRPDRDYGRLAIPEAVVLAPARKYRL